jgi:F-type H+-transporting ATPase subunit epsilon
MAAFHFELVSPERLIFSGNVEAVVVPGAEGAFTVLKDHAPVMAILKPGIVEVDESQTKKQRLFVRGGFADVSSKGLTILAEQAIPVEDLNAAKLDAQISDAEEDLNDATSDEGRRLATEKLAQLREVRAALSL